MRHLPVLVFAYCAAAFGQTQNPANCSADGTVVNAVTGAPIPRARVTQRRSVSVGVITGADGKWALAGMPCGVVQFTAFRPGFITGVMGSSGRLVVEPGGEDGILLDPGSATHDLRIQLFPESSIEGSVLDEFGSELNAAQVDLFRSEISEGRRLLMDVMPGRTDSLGHYRIGGLLPGQYVACARDGEYTYPAGGGKALAYSERCYPGAPGSGAGSTITLEAGAALRVDFNLTPVQAIDIRGEIHGLPPGFWHPSPFEVASPPLSLYRKPNDEVAIPAPTNRREGTFTFSNVMPGPYWLHGAVRAGAQLLFASMAIDARGSDLDGLLVTFAPGVSVNGAVQVEKNPGSVAAPTDVTLVPQESVTSNPASAEWYESRSAFTFSNVERGDVLAHGLAARSLLCEIHPHQ